MKKLILFFSFAFIAYLISPISAFAGCGGQYESPCQSYSMLVDKMVAKPGTSDYVDNLSVSDPRFKPSEYVMFKVTIKNTSTTTLGGMTAKDYVPDYLTPIEGPPGTFDANTRIITWDAGFFNVDEQKTYFFKMQINSQANLPANQGLFPVVNKAQAWSNQMTDDDSSTLFIEKQVATPPKVPSAGPEMGLTLIALQMAGVGAGIYLRKKV